jgi:hypothetical protein
MIFARRLRDEAPPLTLGREWIRVKETVENSQSTKVESEDQEMTETESDSEEKETDDNTQASREKVKEAIDL